MNILAFNRVYTPGYRAGGPIRTIENMVIGLMPEYKFFIVTRDKDSGSLVPYENIKYNQWNEVNSASVMYLPEELISILHLVKIIDELSPDIIYLNSYFDPIFTQRVLWARKYKKIKDIPIIIAPRGEFSAGAISIGYKKKKLFVRVSGIFGLYRGLLWQASSELERDDIKRNLLYVKDDDVCIAMDIATRNKKCNNVFAMRHSEEPLKICFLSRITPKKNLDYALRVLSKVASRVEFTVYGPIESSEYWMICEKIILELPKNISVKYAGVLHPNEVVECLSAYDMFFFPTRGENYGHVIHEALMAGLPVLISDQTPWTLLEERDVGWNIPLIDADVFVSKIDEYTLLDNSIIANKRKKAIEYAIECSEQNSVIEANKEMFIKARRMIGSGLYLKS